MDCFTSRRRRHPRSASLGTARDATFPCLPHCLIAPLAVISRACSQPPESAVVHIHGVETRARVSLGIFENLDLLGVDFLRAGRAVLTVDYASLIQVTIDLPL